MRETEDDARHDHSFGHESTGPGSLLSDCFRIGPGAARKRSFNRDCRDRPSRMKLCVRTPQTRPSRHGAFCQQRSRRPRCRSAGPDTSAAPMRPRSVLPHHSPRVRAQACSCRLVPNAQTRLGDLRLPAAPRMISHQFGADVRHVAPPCDRRGGMTGLQRGTGDSRGAERSHAPPRFSEDWPGACYEP